MKKEALILFLLIVFSMTIISALPVFPGAEGYGTHTTAGRGGTVYRVTNLNNSGTGSLRACVIASGPRVCVFDISGTIFLNSSLTISNPFITIAGQTAPSPGITLAAIPNFPNNQFFITQTNDTLVQHIRIRGNQDFDDPAYLGGNNVVLDHVSISWAYDEVLSTNGGNAKNITVINSIIAEGIDTVINQSPWVQGGGKGFLLVEGTKNISMIRDLYIHNFDRMPTLKGNTQSLHVNNLIYNGGYLDRSLLVTIGDANNQGPLNTTLIGNVAKEGPNSSGNGHVNFYDTIKNNTKVYISDNLFNGGILFDQDPPEVSKLVTSGNLTLYNSLPFPLPSPLTILPSGQVEAYIVDNVGARPADKDPVDTRLINDIINVTGRHMHNLDNFTPPTLDLNTRTLSLPSNPTGDDDADGYTNLEEFFHKLSDCVEGNSNNLTFCNLHEVLPENQSDITAPLRSSGMPLGLLPFNTTQTTLSLTTNEAATCKYGTVPGVAYGSIANTFSTTGSTSHSATISPLTFNVTYNYYVRCSDTLNNLNTNDYTITFKVSHSPNFTYNWNEWWTNETINFSNYNASQLQNILNVKFVNQYGRIQFLQGLNLSSDLDLTNRIKVLDKRIWINSSLIPQFNKSAQLTFSNVQYSNPIIKIDGQDCPATVCQNVTFNNATKTYVFNVTRFSMYEIVEQCEDKVKNYDETGKDCGGKCGECRNNTWIWLLVGALAVGVLFYSFGRNKKRKR